MRDFIHHDFHHQRALRSAETAERRVRLRVGAAAERGDIDVLQVIRVVEVTDGARGHRARQIRRITRAQRHFHTRALQAAVVIETGFVGVDRVVAFAGDHEVVVTIRTQFHRPMQQMRSQRSDARKDARLRFLAAKSAAHPPAFADDVVRRPVEHMRDQMLHFARMLRGTVDEHAVQFLWNGIRDLPFEIELLLSANLEFALQPMRRRRDFSIRIAALQMQRRQHELLFRFRIARRQDGFARFISDHFFALRQRCCAAREIVRFRDHDEHRLAQVQHFVFREDRVVVEHGTAIVLAGDVVGGEHRDHAGRGQNEVEIDRDDARMRMPR